MPLAPPHLFDVNVAATKFQFSSVFNEQNQALIYICLCQLEPAVLLSCPNDSVSIPSQDNARSYKRQLCHFRSATPSVGCSSSTTNWPRIYDPNPTQPTNVCTSTVDTVGSAFQAPDDRLSFCPKAAPQCFSGERISSNLPVADRNHNSSPVTPWAKPRQPNSAMICPQLSASSKQTIRTWPEEVAGTRSKAVELPRLYSTSPVTPDMPLVSGRGLALTPAAETGGAGEAGQAGEWQAQLYAWGRPQVGSAESDSDPFHDDWHAW